MYASLDGDPGYYYYLRALKGQIGCCQEWRVMMEKGKKRTFKALKEGP